MASENARANRQKIRQIVEKLNSQVGALQALETQIKRRDSKDLDELARAGQIAKAVTQVNQGLTTLKQASQEPARGLFG